MRSRALHARIAWHALLGATALWHVWITVASYLANRFYTHDVGNIDYRLYYTWHGRLLYEMVLGESGLATHFQPSLLLLVPFHALFRHILFLPILETLALMSGAWAVAWMVRGFLMRGRAGGPTFPAAGLALGWLFVASPLVGSLVLAFHYDSLTVACFLWALAALANGRPRVFWVLFAIGLGLKADGALYGFVFGPWWIAFGWQSGGWRRRARRGLHMMALCVLWGALALTVMTLVARASGRTDWQYASRYAWLGQIRDATWRDLPAVVWHVVLRPPLRQMFALTLWNALYLPLLAPSSLLLLLAPSYAMGLAAQAQRELFYYYSYPFLPFVWMGAAWGWARALHWLHRRRWTPGWVLAAALLLIAGAAAITLPTRTDGLRRVPPRVLARHGWIRQQIRETIPRDASVAAQFDLLCQVPHRTSIYPLSEDSIRKARYWVIDGKGHYRRPVEPPPARHR